MISIPARTRLENVKTGGALHFAGDFTTPFLRCAPHPGLSPRRGEGEVRPSTRRRDLLPLPAAGRGLG